MSFSCLVFFCFQLWKKGLGGNDKLQSITDRHFLDIEVLNSFWGILILAFSRVWDPLIRRGWNPCKQAVSKEGDYPLYIPVSRPCFLSPLQFTVLQSSKSSKLKLKHQLLLSVGFWIAPTRFFFFKGIVICQHVLAVLCDSIFKKVLVHQIRGELGASAAWMGGPMQP